MRTAQTTYATANREFSALAPRYPKSVEVFFYQGIARLFLADAPGAIASLTTAGKIADSAFAWDIEWYRPSRRSAPAISRRRGSGSAASASGRTRARPGACDASRHSPPASERMELTGPRRVSAAAALLFFGLTSASPDRPHRPPRPRASAANHAQQTPAAAPVTASDIDALIGEAEGLLARSKPSDARGRVRSGARRRAPPLARTLRKGRRTAASPAPCERSRSINPHTSRRFSAWRFIPASDFTPAWDAPT